MPIRKILKPFLKTVGAIFLFIVVYFLAALLIPCISVNSDFKQCNKDGVEIYILTNGIHTDVVCPVKNQYKDWSAFISPLDTKGGDTLVNNIAFGWGDKGFYIETKSWAELKFSTAFKAVFFLSTSAMHISFHKGLEESESCRKICISKESYARLTDYIEKSFALGQNGNPQLIKGASYEDNDAFYEANRTYSLFYTCNTWANNVLKDAGTKACLWTPFNKPIFNKYN